MSLKSEIKRAITNNSNYVAHKVWNPEYSENFAGEGYLTIEINVRKRKRNERKPVVKIKHAYRFPNGMVCAFDIQGNQIPQLQGRYSYDLYWKIQHHSDKNTIFNGF